MQKKFSYLVIAGPTGSGKSALAHQLALAWNGEIINCDSVQLYKEVQIGAAKPSRQELEEVPYHLLDRLNYHEVYDARQYAEEAKELIDHIRSRQRLPIVVGGTGLYLRALWNENFHDLPKDEKLRLELSVLTNEQLSRELQEKDPARAAKIHFNDRFRLLRAVELVRLVKGPVFSEQQLEPTTRGDAFAIKMELPRKQLHQRIAARTEMMLQSGLIAEVQSLLAGGWPKDAKPLQSIGYRQVLDFLAGELDDKSLQEKIIFATRQYAKRQETWFRKVEFDFYLRNADDQKLLLAMPKVW